VLEPLSEMAAICNVVVAANASAELEGTKAVAQGTPTRKKLDFGGKQYRRTSRGNLVTSASRWVMSSQSWERRQALSPELAVAPAMWRTSLTHSGRSSPRNPADTTPRRVGGAASGGGPLTCCFDPCSTVLRPGLSRLSTLDSRAFDALVC
jgi:hypothetical protein